MEHPVQTSLPQPNITASVVSHGHGRLLRSLVQDLATHCSASIGELVVVYNIPESDDLPTTLPFPLRIIRNVKPLGFGANHNLALREASGDLLAVLNPDLRIESDPFPQLLDALAAERRIGLVAPQIIEADGRTADSARELLSLPRLLRRHSARWQTAATSVDWLAGMFMLVRRQAFEDVAGFDERFHLYCEDFDLCARLRLAGWRLALIDSAQVTHLAQRASRRSPRHTLWHVESLLRVWTSRPFWRYRSLLQQESSSVRSNH